jgi:ADP-ribose pyrophosphatase YjhB (NUDIX family)
MVEVVEKAYAYATRPTTDGRELLVFEHRDHDAGVQVPGGTVKDDESPREAAVRELAEETGVTAAGPVERVGTDRRRGQDGDPRRRLFFHVEARESRDRWTHAVTAGEADTGLVFECYWVPLRAASLDHGLGAHLGFRRTGE